MAKLFGYLRHVYPFWNQTVRRAQPRHFMVLPCDHGPGDCGFSRPIIPNKYYVPPSQGSGQQQQQQQPSKRAAAKASSSPHYGGAEIEALWGNGWEFINPSSPSRLVFFLQYNGWTDGLRSGNGACMNCFQPGLDIRLPTPEGHECGTSCGLHHVYNATAAASWYVPVELQRLLLRRFAAKSPTVRMALPHSFGRLMDHDNSSSSSSSSAAASAATADDVSSSSSTSTSIATTVTSQQQLQHPSPLLGSPKARQRCVFSWHGAVRGHNNPTRNDLLRLAARNRSRLCITNTASASHAAPVTYRALPSIPESMLSSRFCYSPRGWDQGDSDRYLPAILYGCIPVMSDRIEAMPLDELPEMKWNATALAIERELLDALPGILTRGVSRSDETEMRKLAAPMVERLLYTTYEFSSLGARGVPCVGCATSRTDCSTGHNRKQGRWGTRSWKERIEKAARDLNIDVAKEPYCGRTSWLGESGERDALEGLVEILRRRLTQLPQDSSEPWAASRNYPLSRAWYVERAKHYKRLVTSTLPLHSLLRATAPSPDHRRNLANLLGYSAE